VGGVFLLSFGVGELGFPGSVSTTAMVADPVGILVRRFRPCLSGISSDAGGQPRGVVQELLGRPMSSSRVAKAAFSEGHVLRSSAGGCRRAGLFFFFDHVERSQRIQDSASTGKVPADKPQGLGLAFRGEPFNRLTTQLILLWCLTDLGEMAARLLFVRRGFSVDGRQRRLPAVG
jgi:hypothetical protein